MKGDFVIMRYADIKKMDIANGISCGIALFVQGCHFHCEGCFNQETWDFNGGKEWTDEIQKYFVDLANPYYIRRVSILGGEPLAPENIDTVYNIVKELRDVYGDTKKIWLYTGYTYEEVKDKPIIPYLDVLVDGKFEADKKNLGLAFRGSENQRIIDIPKTLESGEIITIER